jgi:hypothetical protein
MKTPYNSTRAKAYRNAMLAAINSGMDQKLFTLKPDENLWKPSGNAYYRDGFLYRFEVNGIPAYATVRKHYPGNLMLGVALWLKDGKLPNMRFWAPHHRVAELFAVGTLDRRGAPYLQGRATWGAAFFHCRAHRALEMSAVSIEPNGYRDHGELRFPTAGRAQQA